MNYMGIKLSPQRHVKTVVVTIAGFCLLVLTAFVPLDKKLLIQYSVQRQPSPGTTPPMKIIIQEGAFLQHVNDSCNDFEENTYAGYNIIISNTSRHRRVKPAGSLVSFLEYKRMETEKFIKTSQPKTKYRHLSPLTRYTNYSMDPEEILQNTSNDNVQMKVIEKILKEDKERRLMLGDTDISDS